MDHMMIRTYDAMRSFLHNNNLWPHLPISYYYMFFESFPYLYLRNISNLKIINFFFVKYFNMVNDNENLHYYREMNSWWIAKLVLNYNQLVNISIAKTWVYKMRNRSLFTHYKTACQNMLMILKCRNEIYTHVN